MPAWVSDWAAFEADDTLGEAVSSGRQEPCPRMMPNRFWTNGGKAEGCVGFRQTLRTLNGTADRTPAAAATVDLSGVWTSSLAQPTFAA